CGRDRGQRACRDHGRAVRAADPRARHRLHRRALPVTGGGRDVQPLGPLGPTASAGTEPSAMLMPMNEILQNPALKEWAVIWDALVRGDQIVDLRKGGLRDQPHRSTIRATRFWLYDSFEHQRAELLKPALLPRVAATEAQRPP